MESGLISRDTPNQSQSLDIPLKGAKKLYLVTTNGGDNTDWDHGDWANPVLYNDKNSLSLTELTWKKATAGWGKVRVNQGVSGSDLVVNKNKEKGIGTHANSVIEFDIPEGYTHFKALVGVDNVLLCKM
jgi:hypothetical protein